MVLGIEHSASVVTGRPSTIDLHLLPCFDKVFKEVGHSVLGVGVSYRMVDEEV